MDTSKIISLLGDKSDYYLNQNNRRHYYYAVHLFLSYSNILLYFS